MADVDGQIELPIMTNWAHRVVSASSLVFPPEIDVPPSRGGYTRDRGQIGMRSLGSDSPRTFRRAAAEGRCISERGAGKRSPAIGGGTVGGHGRREESSWAGEVMVVEERIGRAGSLE